MSPRQVYWISIEVLSFLFSLGIAYLIGFDSYNKVHWVIVIGLSIIITFLSGIVISTTESIPTYMRLLNALIYFLLGYGLLIFIGYVIIESFEASGYYYFPAHAIAAIIAVWYASKKFKKNKQEIENFVNEHIVNTVDDY